MISECKNDIKIHEDILCRIENFNGQRIVILYKVDNEQIYKGNEDLLNVVVAIQKFADFDKIVAHLAQMYNTDNTPEFRDIIFNSIDDLVKNGFVKYSEGFK